MERSIDGGDFKFWVRSEKVFTDLKEAGAYAKTLYREHGTFSSMFAVDQRFTSDVIDIPLYLTVQDDIPNPDDYTVDEWWDYNDWV